MKTHIITVLIIFPILVTAQQYNMNTLNRIGQQQQQYARDMHRQMNSVNQKWATERTTMANQQWQKRNMTQNSTDKIANSEFLLALEEKNTKKLTEKAEKLNTDLKTKQENLTTLENKTGNANDSKLQKKIEKVKKEVSDVEVKIAALKINLETSAIKTEYYKNAIVTAKSEKENIEKIQEEEKNLKKEKDIKEEKK